MRIAAHGQRFLGRNLHPLDILEWVPGEQFDCLDLGLAARRPLIAADRKLVGLEFLPHDHPARVAWSDVWPSSGTGQTWDAVAHIDGRGWLLVEAKANLEELTSACEASAASRARITRALATTRHHLGADPGSDWTTHWYQTANRLVVLDHLVRHGDDAHLLFLYFCGDEGNTGRTCPRNAADWRDTLARQQRGLGLPVHHALSDRIHGLIVDVVPTA